MVVQCIKAEGGVFDVAAIEAQAQAAAGGKVMARVAESEDRRLEMERRSREIVARFSCENFARQALSAARAAQQA